MVRSHDKKYEQNVIFAFEFLTAPVQGIIDDPVGLIVMANIGADLLWDQYRDRLSNCNNLDL